MIEHIWSVLCSRSVVDQRSNNVSIQNVLEQVAIRGEPRAKAAIPVCAEVISFWTRIDPGIPSQGNMRLSLSFPSGKIEEIAELAINLSQTERFRTQIGLQGLPVEEGGRHYFNVELQNDGESEWHQVAAIPLTIIFEAPEPEEEQAEREPEEKLSESESE